MKVFIGPHKNWYGPYQLVDMLFFWQDRNPSPEKESRWDYRLNDRLGKYLSGTWVNTVCEKIHRIRGNRKVNIEIHDYDTWDVDSTLSPIILPLLKGLRKIKHGSGYVDLDDVPEIMCTTNDDGYTNQLTFDFYRVENEDDLGFNVHDRYDYVLGEIIWAFEQLQDGVDWEDQYWLVKPKLDLSEHPEDIGKEITPVRFSVHGMCDWDGLKRHQNRISNGLRLFGKYYQTLWD